MIDPDEITTVRVGQLVEEIWSGTDNLPHEVGTDLRRGTVASLATYIAGVIDSSAGLAFNPLSISDGQSLPVTTINEWVIVGEGTYLQPNGFPDVVCTGDINIVLSNSVSWSLGFGIEVEGVDSSQFVKLTTNQTIDGVKTFVQPIIIPDATTDNEAASFSQLKFPLNTPNATVEVGGVPVDEPLANRTAIDVLTQVLVKYLAPLFTSQSCNYPSTVEVGTTVSGSGLFTWAISNGTNIVPNSVNIFDVNADDYLVTGLANDGSQTVTLNSLILNSNNATQVWKISAENTNSEVVESSNITTTAKFKRFFGATSATPTTGTARSLGSEFQSANAQTFTLNTGSTLTKFAVCLPSGVTISSVIDLDALNLNITSNYVSLGTININDIGGTSRVYNLYELNIGAPYSSNHRHQITTI